MKDDYDTFWLLNVPKTSQTKVHKKVTRIKSGIEKVAKKMRRWVRCGTVTDHDARTHHKIKT